MNVIHACTGAVCEVCDLYSSPKYLARRNDPITSKMAAASLPVKDLENLIYDAICKAGEHGVTQDELLDMFPHLSYSSVTARPAALKRKGLVIDSGRKRPGRSGRSQVVLVDAKHIQQSLI